ncbi:SDR family oxidoreductase [Vagococcus hydrophili]|uniref:SDR family oxidoreductase n=1 Tax=Vagococcus hydrophili TaxID=2714947 RepID=A0A6G8AQN6_9ENTE|nr:SDR family NAD(P)-dependent oxidoreductase [Vagococcus hydrophili]QIL47316.1 SDR family oxidoreductase [Vagococcus hydrophili]
MTKVLKGKKAIITGSGSGIGRETAIKFANEGADVGLLDINPESLLQISKELTQIGVENYYETTDVSKEQELLNAIQTLAEKLGGVDILVVNAGINGTWAPIETLSNSDWNRTIQTNLTSTFISVKAVVPYMKEIGGKIVITSSINGNRIYNNFGASAYSTSKAGQVAFMKMAALEFARYNIRVNAVCPGAIDTAINASTIVTEETEEVAIKVEFPEGSRPLSDETGKPDQVANVICFLSSDLSANVTGTEIYVDGAESLL